MEKERSFRVLRWCTDLCTILLVFTDFYRAILSAGNRGVTGSGMGPKKTHPHPQFSPSFHHSFAISTLDTKPRVSSLPGFRGFISRLGECAPGKEPALQGLKGALFHPEGWSDSFEATSLLYKSLLVLRITEQIHCNGSIGTWPVGSPWL